MTAIVHQTVATLPNNPAYEVSKDPWNAPHQLPGAANEIFFSDGAQGITSSPDLTFDAGSKTLSAAPGSGGIVAADTGTFGTSVVTPLVNGVASNLSLYADPDVGQCSLTLTDGATAGDRLFSLICSNGSVLVDVDGNATLGGAGTSIACNSVSATPSLAIVVTGGSVLPSTDNAIDLGGVTADFGADYRWRTGHFATDVRVADVVLISAFGISNEGTNDAADYSVGGTPGITGTLTTADLVGKTLTFTGGIITGYA